MYDKFSQWTYSGSGPEHSLTKDEMLDDITLYWLTNSEISSAQLYCENNNNFSADAQKTAEITIPVAVTVFTGEIHRAPKTRTQRACGKFIYFNEVDKGGHFAAWEEPELSSAEIRAAFRSPRPAERGGRSACYAHGLPMLHPATAMCIHPGSRTLFFEGVRPCASALL
jgi:hypothetical protein